MNESILTGRGHGITEIPRAEWENALSDIPRHFQARLGFMSKEHHLVRNFVVREMPIVGGPVSPVYIAQKLGLPLEGTQIILGELEKHMTFLFRDEQGAVTWAYPVTVQKTPHHITFSTGEQLYAA
ncbi:MAG: hypothetical protein AB9866_07800 [Syntrophobacteraceae bacterium]